MKNGLNELTILDPTPDQLELIEAIDKFNGSQILSIPHIVSEMEGGSGRQFLFIKPAGPADFEVGELVYRVLEDGTFEASTVKKVWLNYLIVYSIATEKETSCHFRDVFHDSDSPAARTASTERRDVWGSNVLRSLSESHSGIHEAINRQAHQVEYNPPSKPVGGFMGDGGF